MLNAVQITGSEHDGKARRVAIMRVSSELLRLALCLPEGTKFYAYREAPTGSDTGSDLEIRVESPTLPEIPSGSHIPMVTPWLCQTRHMTVEGKEVFETHFDKWYPNA